MEMLGNPSWRWGLSDYGDPRGGYCDDGFRGGEDTGPTGNPQP
jgi:hypothetical protein